MATLRITVEWPHGRYHGAEWPPSPWRLYQAMVAGLGVERRREPELEAALRHLEELAAPVVTAPRAAPQKAVRTRVPDNDADLVLVLHARRKPEEARRKAAELGSLRTRRGWRFTGPVTYDFEANAETPGHVQALVAVARSVSAVGQGIDLALARAELLEAPPRLRGIRYTPSPEGRLVLGVPWVGGLERLQMRYRRERTRLAGGEIATGIEVSPRRERYRSGLELPRVRWAAYALRTPTTSRSSWTRGAGSGSWRWCAMRSGVRRRTRALTSASSPSSWGTGAMGGSRPSPFRTSGTGMRTAGSAGCSSSHRLVWTRTRGGAWCRVCRALSWSRRRAARGSACSHPSRGRTRCSSGTGGRGGGGRPRPRSFCRGMTASGAGRARSVRREGSFAMPASARRCSSGRCSRARPGFEGASTRSRAAARGTSSGTRAFTSRWSGRSPCGARSPSGPGRGTDSGSSCRWERNSSGNSLRWR